MFDHQDSVGGFFEAQDHLADPSRLNDETRAFVAGYLTHLVLDEQYITGIYRRFFYPHDTMGGPLRANVMDRLLQFDLERAHGDAELRADLCAALACTIDTIDAGFVDGETLERWRQVACDIAARGMDWDRARGMIENHLRRSGVDDSEGELSGFLDSLPELLGETIGHVTSAEVDAFIERSTDAAAAAVGEVPRMRIIRNAEEGRRTLLARAPLGMEELPLEVRETTFRTFGKELEPDEVVRRIIRDVREDGDNAVRYYNGRIDGSQVENLRVSEEEMRAAHDVVAPEVVEALNFAAGRIRAYHEQQLRGAFVEFQLNGLGQLTRAIERVAIYVPGSAAPLPSTVLMCAIPARIAGVDEVYLASPVLPDGSVPPVKLVAAEIAGVDGVFKAGGAQAIAALAYGTETIPRVDKICGPGNLFVTLAKKQVFGDVGIDAVYGPTETMIIADESADPETVASDLLAQAEHDRLASPILLTPSRHLAEQVGAAIKRQLRDLERAKIANEAIESRGGCVLVNDIDHAIELANEYAPEHLCLVVENPSAYAMKVRNAGGLFPRRGVARGSRRLHRRPQPYHADRRQRPLELPPRRERLPQDHQPRERAARGRRGARPGR